MLTEVLPVCLASDSVKVCHQELFSLTSLVDVIDRQNPPQHGFEELVLVSRGSVRLRLF